jgi:GAF domain-containing protein
VQIDDEVLERSLRGLRERAADVELADALGLCVHTAVRLFGVTGAGVMLLDDSSVLRSAAATDAPGRALEVLQAELGEGPCVDALLNDEIIIVEDLAGDERWPRLQPELPAGGVRAVLGAPVHIAGGAVGSVNVYRDVPYAWSAEDAAALDAYSDVVSGLLTGALLSRQHSEIVGQLRQALDDRVTIERAVGLVMGRDAVDAVTAFNRLRRSARETRRPMAEIAGALLREAAAAGTR